MKTKITKWQPDNFERNYHNENKNNKMAAE